MKTLFSHRLRVAWAIAGATVVLGLGGCQNELSWGNDVHVPVLDDRLSWVDIVPDSLVQEGDPTEAVRFALQDTGDVGRGAVLEIPDTTWAIQYGGEEEGLPEGFPILPGANFIAATDVFEFNVDPSEVWSWSLRRSPRMPLRSRPPTRWGSRWTWCTSSPHHVGRATLVVRIQPALGKGGVPGSATTGGPERGAVRFHASGGSETGLNFDTNMLDILGGSGKQFANPNGYLVQASDSIRLELTFQSLVMEKLRVTSGTGCCP